MERWAFCVDKHVRGLGAVDKELREIINDAVEGVDRGCISPETGGFWQVILVGIAEKSTIPISSVAIVLDFIQTVWIFDP